MFHFPFLLSISVFLPVCSCEHLLQGRVPRGGDQRSAVCEAIQAAPPNLLRARPRQHEAVVLRPGAQQARWTGGDEVGHQGGVHVQRHQRRLLRCGREVPAAVENLDRITKEPGNGVWIAKSQSHLMQHKPVNITRNSASTKVLRVFSSRTTITCWSPTVPSEVVFRQNQSGHPWVWGEENFLCENSEQCGTESFWFGQESNS